MVGIRACCYARLRRVVNLSFERASIASFCSRQLGTPSALGDAPFAGLQFACLLWNHGTGRDVDAATALLSSLIDGGCRYFVCGGLDGEWWHDLVDELIVSRYGDCTGDGRERNHVMTTWHTGESPDDVAFFFVFNTSFDEIRFGCFLVLHLGDGSDVDGVDRAVEARARALAS